MRRLFYIAGILIAFLLIIPQFYSLSRTYQDMKILQKTLVEEAEFSKLIEQAKTVQEEYNKILLEASVNLYSEPRIFNYYKNFGNILEGTGYKFSSLLIQPGYVISGDLKYFLSTVRFEGKDPRDFMLLLSKQVPKLYIDTLQYATGTISGNIKGFVLTPSNSFTINKELFNVKQYQVGKLIAIFNEENNIQGYKTIKRDNKFYVVEVVASGLDYLTARGVANNLAQQGIVSVTLVEGGN